MYVKALDRDGGLNGADDDIDDVFIDMPLQVNTVFTEPRGFYGEKHYITLVMLFRVTCLENYYGADCTAFCLAPNNSYVCDTNGVLLCNDSSCKDNGEFSQF